MALNQSLAIFTFAQVVSIKNIIINTAANIIK